MTGDQESRIRFTDDEYAYLRFVRFGQLPERVRPDQLVELVETDPRRDVPELAGAPREWDVRGAAG